LGEIDENARGPRRDELRTDGVRTERWDITRSAQNAGDEFIERTQYHMVLVDVASADRDGDYRAAGDRDVQLRSDQSN